MTERLIVAVLAACAAVAVATAGGIVAVLAIESAGFFAEVSPLRLLTDDGWTPLFSEARYGLLALVCGTFLTSAIALLCAVPVGLLAGVHLAELARPGRRRVWKALLEVLAGVPSLVFGYFALVAVTPLLQRVVPGLAGFNALAAGLVMGLMLIPFVATLVDDALRAVPRALREAAWSLGAGEASTILRVVLPAARGRLMAAFVLAAARAVGETMIVAIAAGQEPRVTLDPRVPVETMTAFMVQVSLGDVPHGSLAARTLFVVGAALFLMTLVLNALLVRVQSRSAP